MYSGGTAFVSHTPLSEQKNVMSFAHIAPDLTRNTTGRPAVPLPDFDGGGLIR